MYGMQRGILYAAINAVIGAWSPRNLFMAGEQGVWYDPSDFERYMGSRGTELVVNGGFDAGETPWNKSGNVALTITSGWAKVTATSAANAQIMQTMPAGIAGKWVEVVAQYRNLSPGRTAKLALYNATTPGDVAAQSSTASFGSLRDIGFVPSGASVQVIGLLTNAPAINDSVEWTGFSVRELTALDTATLFQDAAGTTPVTAMEQPVGLMLDKRLGLVRGAELYAGGIINGVAVGGPAFTNYSLGITASAGKTYEVALTISNFSGTGTVSLAGTPGTHFVAAGAYQANGVYTFRVTYLQNFAMELFTRSTNTCTFSGLSVRELPGNHASQSTAAARPVLSARKNLLTDTENFAVWSNARVSTQVNAAIAPDGTMTADKIIADGTTDPLVSKLTSVGTLGGRTFTYSVWLWTDEGQPTDAKLYVYDNSVGDVGESAVVLTTTPVRYTITKTFAAGELDTNIYVRVDLSQTAPVGSYLYVWGAQLEIGTETTRYQRVNTATDYDSVGFPHYLRFDGVDDFLQTGNISLSASAFLSMGVQTDKIDSEYRPYINWGTSGFPPAMRIDSLGGTGQWRSRFDTASDSNVVAGGAGMATSSNVTSIAVQSSQPVFRLNGTQAGNYPPALTGSIAGSNTLRIGGSAEGGSRRYAIILRDGPMAEAQMFAVERYLASKTGVTL